MLTYKIVITQTDKVHFSEFITTKKHLNISNNI